MSLIIDAVNANNNNLSPHPGSSATQVSEIATKPLPPTPTSNSKQGNHNEKANDATTAAAAIRSAKATSKNNNVVSFTLKWICMVLTMAAAIVFGIWAPLSYRATADGNRDNNEVQNSMMHQVMTANGIASSALLAASAQCTALESMQDRLNAMGQLAMVDFCMTHTPDELSGAQYAFKYDLVVPIDFHDYHRTGFHECQYTVFIEYSRAIDFHGYHECHWESSGFFQSLFGQFEHPCWSYKTYKHLSYHDFHFKLNSYLKPNCRSKRRETVAFTG